MKNEIRRVQHSFAHVRPIADVASKLFYERLFAIAPETRPLFAEDLTEQRDKLMKALTLVVHGLDDLNAIMPAITALARRHAGYGVVDAHYDKVGEALLWTLEQGLGPKFTPEVKDAWTAVYGVLAQTMRDAARDEAA